MNEAISRILSNHGLRKTAIRREVLSIFLNAGATALSNSDIEERIKKIDRITLYRTIKNFEKHGLIHQANDRSGIAKYALCSKSCSSKEHHDDHAHFHCDKCGETICVDGSAKTKVLIPSDFIVRNIFVTLEGTCDKCSG